MSEADRLRALGADIQDQDELERNVGRQADQVMTERAKELDQQRLEKAKVERTKLESQIRKINSKLRQPILPPVAAVKRLEKELDHYHSRLSTLSDDIQQITTRIRERQGELDGIDHGTVTNGRMPGESQRDFLIRTGKITPFSSIAKPKVKITSDLRETLLDAEQRSSTNDDETEPDTFEREERSHVHLKRPGFRISGSSSPTASEDYVTPSPGKKRRFNEEIVASEKPNRHPNIEDDEFIASSSHDSGLEDALSLESSNESSDAFQPQLASRKRRTSRKPVRKVRSRSASELSSDEKDDMTSVDDGNETLFKQRLTKWIVSRSSARRKIRAKMETPAQLSDDDEWFLPHPSESDLDLGNGYRLPGDIHPALFDYQKIGVKWLSELHQKQVGGIVGDEMGLGKTIQIIAMLASLHYSKKIQRPIIVVCPATVMKQWVNEFHTWWPAFRVSILHASGSGMMNTSKEAREEDLMTSRLDTESRSALTKTEKAASRIINRVVENGHVLVTTYAGLQNYAEFLIPIDWEYAVLDEGHKIRNPNSSITIHCKELRTANRIILSGTPIQNNLTELWSLFDFIYPMRLGTLVTFRTEFEIPIRLGGYANATNYQVTLATKCAETLKDSIQPHLLQRMKVDVAADLPKKTEQVLFCKLTPKQRLYYRRFLDSSDVRAISEGKRNPLYGIDMLRKICNHPDLTEHKKLKKMPEYDYGNPSTSGKMLVVRELIDMWTKGGHKTLLFCQYKIMLDILQKYIGSMPGVNYCRMDGQTSVKHRQDMIDQFNNDPGLHVFLLTTKTGGLGVNLTGADRVIIFDPDWNPSTDMQARERAWRLGQKREVQIYRLMMAGTIEEKMFHRQIFKQFLTNKILKDPRQRSDFPLKELHDLFTLEDDSKDTETGKMFRGTETRIGESQKPTSSASNTADPPLTGHNTTDTSDTTQSSPGLAVLSPLTRPEGSSAKDTDIRQIEGVSKIQDDEPSKLGERNLDDDAEKRLLAGIFARSGVSSTVEHDRIVNGKIDYGADQRILNQHAEEVVKKAAASLKRAELQAKANPIGTVTWTGEVGSGGRSPSPERKGGITGGGLGTKRSIGGVGSANILSNLRQAASKPHQTNRRTSRDSEVRTVEDPTAEDFGLMIIKFLVAQGGMAFTRMLTDQFRHNVNTPQRVAVFNAMLNEVATLKKGINGRGQWTIKPEYRNA